MQLSLVFTAMALASMPVAVQAETIYLSCQQVSKPKFGPADLFAKPPADQDQVIQAIYEAGFAGFVVDPPETWAVDLSEGTIKSPGDGRAYQITRVTDTEITGSFVSENKNIFLWGLNRINGTVAVTNTLRAEDQKEWKAKHGKLFPILWMWSQKCNASDQPAM
ncbi:hypothetical protein [Sphingobium sp. UBA5915]|uniref:hypothetical protein n=1 Tax=Sphingobium sp. UBA5915 TaxID=1947530 RepID=UPI0025CBC33A|nr:hypothetical protein [Sphingobium sp. UBA5915]